MNISLNFHKDSDYKLIWANTTDYSNTETWLYKEVCEFTIVSNYNLGNKTINLDNIVIDNLENRQKGFATKVMKDITNWANKYKINIVVFVEPFNKSRFSQAQLKKWYKRFRFKSIPKYKLKMIYRFEK